MYWNDNLQSFNKKWSISTSLLRGLDFCSSSSNVKITRIERLIPGCQKSCLIWRTMTNILTNTYVVIFCRLQFLVGARYHSRYQNFEFTGCDRKSKTNWLQRTASYITVVIWADPRVTLSCVRLWTKGLKLMTYHHTLLIIVLLMTW